MKYSNNMYPLTLIISVNVRHCIIYPHIVIPTLIISFALREDSASHSRRATAAYVGAAKFFSLA
jgi:hypothetical protein